MATQSSCYRLEVRDEDGNPVPYAEVTILDSMRRPARLFFDPTLLVRAASPLVADCDGYLHPVYLELTS